MDSLHKCPLVFIADHTVGCVSELIRLQVRQLTNIKMDITHHSQS